MKTIEVGSLLDEHRWSNYQKLFILATALTIILDGVDNQLLGNAIPSLMKEWSLPRGAFSAVLAVGPLGMMFGGAFGGMLGDRIGRRSALLASVISFAALTLATSTVGGTVTLGIFRFLSGLGLGGAMPNAAALASEYSPRRERPFAVTVTIVCIPLGGTLAAILSAQIVPVYGWRMLFVLGGLSPIVLTLLLLKILPESPHYMARRPERWVELIALLRRLGHDVPAGTVFVTERPEGMMRAGASLSALFTRELRRDTLSLFGSFFFCLLANYIGILLLVTALTGVGFALSAASNALGLWNVGGVAGAILGAILIQRFGSRITMLSLTALAIATAFGIAGMSIDPQTRLLAPMLTLLGGTLNAVQTTMYALAANIYPSEIRSTGIGAAVAIGRVGNVLASYTGNFALDVGGPSAFFSSFGMAMVIVFISLADIRRHIGASATELPSTKSRVVAGG